MSSLPPNENESVLAYASTTPPPFAAVVWCRILAVWMFAWGLHEGTTFLASIAMVFAPGYSLMPALAQITAAAIMTGVWLLMAWYCWRRAPSLARKMSAGTEAPGQGSGMSSNELLAVIVTGIGIYMLADGLPTLAWVITTIIQNVRTPGTSPSVYERTVISGIVRCAIGVWLIMGTDGIVRRIREYSGRWHDHAGKSHDEDSTPPDAV